MNNDGTRRQGPSKRFAFPQISGKLYNAIDLGSYTTNNGGTIKTCPGTIGCTNVPLYQSGLRDAMSSLIVLRKAEIREGA